MELTSAQLVSLKNDIAADPTFGPMPKTPDNAFMIADAYNTAASPDWWVWRTSVFESEITRTTTPEGTDWSWTTYINRSQGERDAWARLFMGGGTGCNPSLPNVRQGVNDIFSGTGAAATQRAHIANVCRRKATRLEKLLATGTGSTASPGTMTFEGKIDYQDVMNAWAA